MNAGLVSHEEAISDLIRAEDGVYTWEMVDVKVPEKPVKRIAVCRECGESFVLRGDEGLCRGCAERSSKNIQIDLTGG
ncbi:MAG: hypothetical protein A4E51_00319 [Methanosaeta sp. PtaU1.Bin055]|nr:MAG: hypothetical protein A4E51_00319 [Methanosaeta sp. PtaU1.Bin055]